MVSTTPSPTQQHITNHVSENICLQTCDDCQDVNKSFMRSMKNQLCILKLFLVIMTILIFAHGTHHMFLNYNSSMPLVLNTESRHLLDVPKFYSNDIHLFLSCDDAEKIALYTVINSIILNHNTSRSRLYFHVLVEYNAEIYEKEINILFDEYLKNDSIKYEIKQFSNYPDYYNFYPNYMTRNKENRRICKQMNFARFYFTDIFDLDLSLIKKAIYLDVDMIVQKDIQKLYDHKVNNKMPVQSPYYERGYKLKDYNLFAKAGRHRKLVKLLNISKELKSNKHGFNTGIYLYDLNFWVKNNLTQKYEYYVKLNYDHKGELWTLGMLSSSYIIH